MIEYSEPQPVAWENWAENRPWQTHLSRNPPEMEDGETGRPLYYGTNALCADPVAWRYRPVDKKSPWSNVTEYRRTPFGRIGMEEQPLFATPSIAGTVSVEAAAKVAECAFDDRPRSRVGHHSHMDWEDGFRDGTNAAATALRALNGEGGR